MESNSRKRVKEFNETEEEEDGSSTSKDRISYLPDSILNHILSFLDTEDIFRTSFLSKRWKSLCTPLHRLNLCLERFSKNSTLKDQKNRFTQFVDRMIVLHKDQHLKELRLTFDISQFEIDCPQVDNWVNFVMTSDSVIVHLDFWGERDGGDLDNWKQRCYTLPQCSSFPHKSVEGLVLTHCVFRPSQYMSFSSIKTAVLTGVHLPDDSVYDFIAAAPCLENLYLVQCIVPAHLKFHVPESKLKRLKVVSSLSFSGEDISSLDINAPSLRYFTFAGNAIDNISLNHPKNLFEAKLNFLKGFTPDKHHLMLCSLLADVCNVDTLILSKSCFEVLNSKSVFNKTVIALLTERNESLPTPPLCNLKHLRLKRLLGIGADEVLGMACLFRSSPCLETLSINLNYPLIGLLDLNLSEKFDYSKTLGAILEFFTSECLHNLKKVVIKGFEGRILEMDFIKCILMKSLSLKLMIVYKKVMRSRYIRVKQTGNKTELKLLKAFQQKTIENLLALRRGSRHAEVYGFARESLPVQCIFSNFPPASLSLRSHETVGESVMMMESNSRKRVKEFDETEEDGSTSKDRISCLPDSILNHILSFLDTEDIVRMSFLSNRWKSLCTPLPGLDLCLERFSENSTLKDQNKRFTEFVDRVIVLYKGHHLKEFRLKFDISQFEIDYPQVDNWVNFVMTSDSDIVHLDFWGERDGSDPDCWKQRCYTLPQCSSFPHKSVEGLVLTHCVFRPSQYMSFFSIKTAVLTGVHLPDDSVYEFIAASPCLENLYLIQCIVPAQLKCHVPESKLKILVVNSSLSVNGEDISSLDINAPSLLHFTFAGKAIDNISLNHPKNLIEANLNFLDDFNHIQQHIMLRSLLADIANVDSLVLSRSCLKVLSPKSERSKTIKALITKQQEWLPTPPLPNLKRLTLKEVLLAADEIMVLACFLRTSPCLETLSIELFWPCGDLHSLDISEKFDYSEDWLYSFMFSCDCLHSLKKVVIKGFEGRNHEMTFINAILMNSLGLKVMFIYKEAMKSRYTKLKQTGNKKELKLLKAHQQKTTENLLALRRGSRLAGLVLLP